MSSGFRLVLIAAVALLTGLLTFEMAPGAVTNIKTRDDAALHRGDYWTMWLKASQRRCPGNRIEAVGMSDEAVELVDGFDSTLPRASQRAVERISNYSVRCRRETMGFSCLLAVDVDAFNRMGLLDRFAAYGCRRYACDSDGMCSVRQHHGSP